MLGKIVEIVDGQVIIDMAIDINNQVNLINLHVVFEDDKKKIIGEIVNITQKQIIVNILGEIKNNSFVPGNTAKPSFKSKVRVITLNEVEYIFGSSTIGKNQTFLGYSNIYENYKININNNAFFSNHFAILGNSGAGKSCAVASLIQNLFTKGVSAPLKANFLLFDAFGEYTAAFKDLKNVNPNLIYKSYTTNPTYSDTEVVKIPTWLLDVDDLALLLDVTSQNQLPILEKALKLVPVLKGNSQSVIQYKNDIIARAIEDILLSGATSTKIRDQVIAILTKFNTEELNLESKIIQPGYVRTLKQCLYIDKSGKLQEIELVTEFVRSFINKDLDKTLGNNEKPCCIVDRNQYIQELVTDKLTGKKCQIVNFNINYVDDRLAKVITKIISKMLFAFVTESNSRGSIPFHIIIEEAHRYVQKDKDIELLGYNIFERITKEGRKYGIFLGLITQRPSELSDTAISQCSNFIIFRTIHPKDLDYIRNMVPNISTEIIGQLRNLQPGTCMAFGTAFKVPILISMQMPNPTPNSNNVDLGTVWYI